MSVNASSARKLYAPPMPTGGQRLGSLPGISGGSAQPAAAQPYRTVGDYYQAQAQAERQQVGRVFEGVAELAPPVLLGQMAAISISHDYKADQRIFNLPWDANGQWRTQAQQIKRQEYQAADHEIANLPLVSGVRTAGSVLADGASEVATAAYDGAVAVGEAAEDASKSVARGLLGALAYTGQGMVDFANSQKPYFQ